MSTWLWRKAHGRGLLVAVAAASMPLGVLLLRRNVLRVEVAGESMTPALLPGDFLALRRGVPETLKAGEIVALLDPRPGEGGRMLLKRVIGLPGEALRVGGGVQVNGRVLEEPYAHDETPLEQHRGINRLGEDELFVMGDHRGASTDSRDFGPVRRESILGVAVVRYWPPERAGWLHAPERRLLGVADRPGPGAQALPESQPLPWLGVRVTPDPDAEDSTPPASH